MGRPTIAEFQDEDTYRVDWIRYFEAMKAYCNELESRLRRAEDGFFCLHCAHSVFNAPFPGEPSGERPCHFCVRNKERTLKPDCWYDGSDPIKVPMDCYHSVDMNEQIEAWNKKALKGIREE